MRFCVVIPNHNHKDPIRGVIEALKPFGFPVVLVDDGSDAASKEVFAQIVQDHPEVTLVTRSENGGKGAAVKDGLRKARQLGFTHAVQVDADGQHDLADFPKFIEAARANPRAVILGQPVFDHTAPKARLFGRKVTRSVIWLQCLSRAIKDGLCGYRCYPLGPTVRVLERRHAGNRMDFDPEIAVFLFWEGLKVVNIPTKVRYIEGNLSNYRYWADNLLVARSHTLLGLRSLALAPYTLLKRLFGPKGGPDWYERQERTNDFWINLALILLTNVGSGLTRLMMYPVILYFYLSDRRGRDAITEFLSQVQLDPRAAEKLPKKPGAWASYLQYWHFGDLLLERFEIWRHKGGDYQVEIEGQKWVDEIDQNPKGALFISGHFGGPDLLKALSLSQGQRPVHSIMFNKNAQSVMNLLKKIDPDSNDHIVELSRIDPGSIFELQAALERGELVGVLADRLTYGAESRYSLRPFFGRPAPMPHGPWILASLLECPVYVVFAVKEGRRQFRFRFVKLADQVHLDRKRRVEQIDQLIDRYLAEYEAMICRYPQQWTNFYPFWEEP
ncbi:MAG: glycosyltransferase [bacterium]|nr:glycosyltransferase [bacterium]